MHNDTCTIVIPTHSSYLDVCINFIELLCINWNDCPYEIVLSITGNNIRIDGIKSIYNGEEATLPQCIYAVTELYVSDYYFVFLGDAFICNRVDTNIVRELIQELKREDIEYCSLRPKKSRYPVHSFGKMARYINYKDRYCHSFIAFLANKKFIGLEFSNQMEDDLDFELKYLEIANTSSGKCYFEKRLVLTNDIWGIKPGIDKGKWNRDVRSYLKREYKEIPLADRPMVSIKRQLVTRLRNVIVWYLPDSLRKGIKKIIRILSGKEIFDTEQW